MRTAHGRYQNQPWSAVRSLSVVSLSHSSSTRVVSSKRPICSKIFLSPSPMCVFFQIFKEKGKTSFISSVIFAFVEVFGGKRALLRHNSFCTSLHGRKSAEMIRMMRLGTSSHTGCVTAPCLFPQCRGPQSPAAVPLLPSDPGRIPHWLKGLHLVVVGRAQAAPWHSEISGLTSPRRCFPQHETKISISLTRRH